MKKIWNFNFLQSSCVITYVKCFRFFRASYRMFSCHLWYQVGMAPKPLDAFAQTRSRPRFFHLSYHSTYLCCHRQTAFLYFGAGQIALSLKKSKLFGNTPSTLCLASLNESQLFLVQVHFLLPQLVMTIPALHECFLPLHVYVPFAIKWSSTTVILRFSKSLFY